MNVNQRVPNRGEIKNIVTLLLLCFGFGIFVFVMVYFVDVVNHRGSIQYFILMFGVWYFTSTLIDLIKKAGAYRSARVEIVVPVGGRALIPHPCFRVNKIRLSAGNTQYALIFYEDRLLFAKIGGQWATTKDFGSYGVHDLGDEIRAQKMVDLSKLPSSELLKMDKKNFEILYIGISSIEIKRSEFGVNGPRTGKLSIEAKKKQMFDIAPEENYENCERMVIEFLGHKLKR